MKKITVSNESGICSISSLTEMSILTEFGVKALAALQLILLGAKAEDLSTREMLKILEDTVDRIEKVYSDYACIIPDGGMYE